MEDQAAGRRQQSELRRQSSVFYLLTYLIQDLGPFRPLAGRTAAGLAPVARAGLAPVLRLGAWELLHYPEVPFRVILDEAIDLAHRFGAEQGHAFVNGVLDKAVKSWRPGTAI